MTAQKTAAYMALEMQVPPLQTNRERRLAQKRLGKEELMRRCWQLVAEGERAGIVTDAQLDARDYLWRRGCKVFANSGAVRAAQVVARALG